MSSHKKRKHSKFSASGSERWLNCAASVELEEPFESKDTPWSLEGTEAHEVLEVLWKMLYLKSFHKYMPILRKETDPMIKNAFKMITKVLEVKKTLVEPELLVEKRVHNSEIHPEMFGTVDNALVELFGTLHVFDYKYGQGHVVSPEENTQMIQYALGLLEEYDWNFEKVVLHICQPRAVGSGHKQWEVSIEKMREYRELWRKGVARVDKGGNKPFAGNWCYWCKAKSVCPAKVEKRNDKIGDVFKNNPFESEDENGLEEKSYKKESRKIQEGRKKKNPFPDYESEDQRVARFQADWDKVDEEIEQEDFY